jgi:hypothetical protein
VVLDEREGPRPRVSGGCRELLLSTVEEAVRGALVRDDLVVDASRRERLAERGVVVRSDVLVGTGLEREDRSLEL